MNAYRWKGYPGKLISALTAFTVTCCLLVAGLRPATATPVQYPQSASTQPERIVDCLLPGRIHSLGGRIYQSPPRPEHLPAIECEIRGGDFLVYDRANIESSLAWWVELANQGDAEAMRYVGEIFERGLGGEPDFAAAASWYKRASDAGNVPAKISLAQLYKRGQGVPLDPEQAKRLYADAFGTSEESIDLDSRSITGSNDRMFELQTQIDEQQAQITRLTLELHQSQQRVTAATDELNSTRQQASSADATVQRLASEVERATTARDSNEEQLRLAQERSQQLENLRQQLRVKDQEATRLQQLLAYSENQVRETQERLEQAEAAAEAAKQDLDSQRASAGSDDGSSGQTTDVEQRLTEQQEVIAQLRKQNRANETEVTRYRQMLQELEKASAEAEAMAAVAEERGARIEQLEELATQSDNQLALAQAELEAQRRKADEAERALVAAREQTKAVEKESAADEEQLAQNLAAQREELARLNEEITRVKVEASSYKSQLDAMATQKKQVQEDIVGPTIEIIDPSLMATRGLSVTATASIVSTVPQRNIVGRVIAPAGLLSLTVNNLPTEVNDRGVFKALVDLMDPSSTINIVAIDEQGKRATKAIEFTTPVARNEPAVHKKRQRYNVSFGNYYALLIGNSDYQFFPDLKTPVNDVDAIAEVLRDKYDFKTTVLHNATNKELFKVLYEDLLPNLTSDDNLLIYYAGHGDYIESWESYTWLPVDAQKDNPQNYFWNDDLAKYLKTMSAKQILVIADSCYSGALTRDASTRFTAGQTDAEYERWLKKWSHKAARVALTSGGMQPVLDAGGGSHSVFAKALLEVLNENTGILPSQDLGQQVGARVSYAAEELDFQQEPEWAPINFTGHEGGDFFFVSNP